MSHKIVAIDDHPATLDIVVTTLKQYGYEAYGSQSPIEGLKLVARKMPDLVLLDMNMPEMDGKDVCRRLRANPKLAPIPVIMFTAEDEAYQKLAGFDAGADDYVTKPTEPEELIARIEAILGPLEESYSEEEELARSQGERLKHTFFRGKGEDAPPAAAESENGRLVMVLGARGGAGATFMAINLAAGWAQQGHATTLVDLDLFQGHISLYLNQHNRNGGVNALAGVPDIQVAQRLPQQFVAHSKHLQLLLASPNLDGRQPPLDAGQTTALFNWLRQSGQDVVVDCGHILTESVGAALRLADQIFVCLPPERIALSAAKRLLMQLWERGIPTARVHALIIDIGGKIKLPRDAVEAFLNHPLHEVVTVDERELGRTVNKGTILVQVFPQSPTTQLLHRLMREVVAV